ncbi:1-hydroxycarotenoid 3,4-desaturase CrtD [Tabrizicola sp. BL-A-41-H6]|uniref:1-hydroxycarotenoid 3,4-desaturase CrtD n=1 Tax=Tabrizicola sp. BL-A-41-H6 TaxID=3421107 RepID=UPI003D67176C
MEPSAHNVVVIGAGMGGLAAAIRLAAAGCTVTVVETADTPGGKMRTLPSAAGPVDAGPTVLTMRHVFDELFSLAGQRLDDHITLIPQPILARHWWPDGSTLDLHTDPAATLAAIEAFAGPREAAAFRRFDALSAALFHAFDAPVMHAARPNLAAIARTAARQPHLWPALLPGMTLTRLLRLHFRDPRLVQLFARYATYVGGRPAHSPGVLALIWRAEAQGVWAVKGGMHHLATALADLATRLGVRFRYATRAQRIVTQGGRVTGVQIEGGATLSCTACVFNGDPAALSEGHLGTAPTTAVARGSVQPRSLSAWVWSFAATPEGPLSRDLIHHNVIFSPDPKAEFGPIGQGRMPEQPTLYICAEDRSGGTIPPVERFEIIVNAPAGHPTTAQEFTECQTRTFAPLQRLGLGFSPPPNTRSLTTPSMLGQLFPGSNGSIYGRSPEGMLAAFQRPSATTTLPGLYLAGGCAHPGAGVPMAALSGRHAAAAILNGRTSPSTSRPTATPGGISTVSPTTGRAPSR